MKKIEKSKVINFSYKKNIFLMGVSIIILFASWITPQQIFVSNQQYNASCPLVFFSLIISFLLIKEIGFLEGLKGIGIGVLFVLLSFFYGQMTLLLPSPEYANHTSKLYAQFLNEISENILPFLVALIASAVIGGLIFLQIQLFFKSVFKVVTVIFSALIGELIYVVIFNMLVTRTW